MLYIIMIWYKSIKNCIMLGESMFNLKNESKKSKICLLSVVTIFFIIGLYSVLTFGEDCLLGSLQKFNNDDVKYIRSAWTFLDKHIFTYQNPKKYTIFIMPGITIELAFLMSIFGKFSGIIAFRIFQVILQTLSMMLIFFIARKIFNSKIAIIACSIDLFYISEMYVSCLILTETTFKFLLLLLVYISIYAIETKRIKYYITGGIILGIACLFRPNIALYPLVILIMWCIYKYSIKEMLKYAVITSVAFFIVMSPWWIRNYNRFNKFIPATESAGNPFWLGTRYQYKRNMDNIPCSGGNASQIRQGIKRLKINVPKHPFKYLYWYTVGKSKYFWKKPFYWKHIALIELIVLYHKIILILAVVSIVGYFINRDKNKNHKPLLIFWTVAYFNLSYLPFFANERYAYPVMSFMMIFAAVTVYKTILKIKKLKIIKDNQ